MHADMGALVQVSDCWAGCNGNTTPDAVAQLQAQATQFSRQAITALQSQLHVTQQQVPHA